MVEIIAKPGARVRYTTVQNWSQNVYNLVTKRAVAHEDATMEWVDCNLGSKLTMNTRRSTCSASAPTARFSRCVRGQGPAPGRRRQDHPRRPEDDLLDLLQVDLQGRGPDQLPRPARGRQGRVESKSKGGLRRAPARRALAPDTYPTIRIGEDDVDVGHEATVSKIGEEQIFYLQSRGLDEVEASKMIVNGFIEPITKELPMEYAVEMNRLIELQMEGSIG